MTRHILLTIILALALVVTASAIIEAAREVAAETRGVSPVPVSQLSAVIEARVAALGAMVVAWRTP